MVHLLIWLLIFIWLESTQQKSRLIGWFRKVLQLLLPHYYLLCENINKCIYVSLRGALHMVRIGWDGTITLRRPRYNAHNKHTTHNANAIAKYLIVGCWILFSFLSIVIWVLMLNRPPRKWFCTCSSFAPIETNCGNYDF